MVGFIFALIMIFVIAYLWYAKKWQQKIGWVLLAIPALIGFLFFAPVAPYQFQQIVLGNAPDLGTPLIVGFVGLSVVLLLSLLPGRFFCGYLCPAGAVQEIAYHAPVPKINPQHRHGKTGMYMKWYPSVVRRQALIPFYLSCSHVQHISGKWSIL